MTAILFQFGDVICEPLHIIVKRYYCVWCTCKFGLQETSNTCKYSGDLFFWCINSLRIHAIKYACLYFWGVSESVRIHYFTQTSKILLDPPVTHSLIHAVYTHACTCVYTHKPFIGFNCASVWSVSVSRALIRHHSSCILTSIQSNTDLRDWAGTLLHGDDCYHGNCGGVRPTNKPGNAMLSCFYFFLTKHQLGGGVYIPLALTYSTGGLWVIVMCHRCIIVHGFTYHLSA